MERWGSPNTSLNDWLSPGPTAKMPGYEPCVPYYSFENVSDLHTSDNVTAGFPPVPPLPGSRSYDGKYLAVDSITAGPNVQILPNTSVEFYAKRIRLTHGFHADSV